MSKIGLIIGREFNQRVRKRTFILTTVLTPLLMVVLMVAPVLLNKVGGSRQLEILVLDRSGWIAPQLQSGALLKLTPTDLSEDELGAPGNRYNYLVIGEDVLSDPGDVRLYTKEALTFDVENDLKSQLGRIIDKRKLEAHDIRNLSQIMQEVKTDVSMQTFQRHDTGERRASSGVLSMTASYLFGFLIYMFVFMYGVMVMHGVIEEKNSRVLEIIVSSVRPFELMLGKILGIASVALVQFLIWVALILALGTAALHLLTPDALIRSAAVPGVVPQMDAGTLAAIRQVTDGGFLLKLFGGFLVYFVGGYLLYAAIFAAVGSAVDNAQDAQQLQMPATIPLVFAIVVMFTTMQNPNGTLSVWCSIIPFTSPIVMMARIPYGVPAWQLALSVALLYGSFLSMVWVAGKIYRVGIFMYGKKPGFAELYKWIKYKG